MTLEQIVDAFLQAGFSKTTTPASLPLICHGVPGCGKSTVIRGLLTLPDVAARTCGQPYGATLVTAGVLPADPSNLPRARHRILDEYQLADAALIDHFTILVGDPFQGPLRKEPHLVKATSHRVPRPVCDWLRAQDFQILGTTPGRLDTSSPYTLPKDSAALRATVIHLGQASAKLASSHRLPSICVSQAQGLEWEHVTLIAHSSEFRDRVGLYVAATRACTTLTVLSDKFHEFCSTS